MLAQSVSTLSRAFVDTVLPLRCLKCRVIVGEGALCADCWGDLTFLSQPCCQRCGYPFEFDVPGETVCGACAREVPAYDRARAAFAYNDASRDLLIQFKHADKTFAVPAFVKILSRAGWDLLDVADFIAPVPLHRRRLFSRRYNQSALLTVGLAKSHTKVPIVDLLIRERNTKPQARMSPAGRRRNVQGAFSLNPRYADRVAGKRVLLVDDVLTTGATVEACARVLSRSGAGATDVLTLARVVRAQN